MVKMSRSISRTSIGRQLVIIICIYDRAVKVQICLQSTRLTSAKCQQVRKQVVSECCDLAVLDYQ